MKKSGVLFIVILSMGFFACSGEQWEGYVYPDKGNLLIHHNVGKFQNLESCRNASLAKLESAQALQKGYYKCGKNCKSNFAYYDNACEEILRYNYYQ